MPILQNLPSGAVAVLALLAFVVLVALVRAARTRQPRYAYRREPLLSGWERSVFGELASQLRPGQHLCPQVRLADMLKIEASDQKGFWTGFNRVAKKSLDFVVVDLESGEAVLAIELDDKTHGRQDRKRRDGVVNGTLGEAGILLVRFKPRQRLDIREHLDRVTSRGFGTPAQIAAE